MHTYRAPASAKPSSSRAPAAPTPAPHADDEDEDDEMFPHPEGDGDGGYSYGGPGDQAASVPLVTKQRLDEGDVVFDGDEELAQNGHTAGTGEVVPYAHRDLKPGCVLSLYRFGLTDRYSIRLLET